MLLAAAVRSAGAATRAPPIVISSFWLRVHLTDRASAAATGPSGHYLTFLRPDASANCMRLLGGAPRAFRRPATFANKPALPGKGSPDLESADQDYKCKQHGCREH
jgi:hypothetical protein